ncbi:MAG TPA: sensor domain-containing protein [Mycobacteriales bacterium]|nr:sensor domain-containing protein [Mycobacteriales bacterium]
MTFGGAAGTGESGPGAQWAEAEQAGARRRLFGADPIPLNPLRALVSPYTWLATTHLLASLFLGIGTFTSVVTLLALSVGLLPVGLLGVPLFVLTVYYVRGLAALERWWFQLTLGVRIPPPAQPPRAPSLLRNVWTLCVSAATWRQLFYQLALLPIGIATMTVTLATWSGPVALLLLPAYYDRLPEGANLGLFRVTHPAQAALVAAAGALLLLSAPLAIRVLSTVNAAVGRALLGRFSAAELTERVGELEQSRRRVVDSAEAERRRIERDLHDGAQQRLVGLAMTLGRAKARYATDPTSVGDLLNEAHEEAKQAVVELRDLTRGIHPPVLTDRGLDAALSALAARSPVPVAVEVDVEPRPSPTVEAIAYFVVAEALTNLARHAHATQASVLASRVDDGLRIIVLDDGRGGADPEAGTGLRGLADRVSGVDGTLMVYSPPGGPTVITVELPCG